MKQDHVLKKFNFDLLTPSPGSGEGVCWGKIATILLHSRLSLILYATWSCYEMFDFDLMAPTAGSGRVCGQNISYHTAAFGDSL